MTRMASHTTIVPVEFAGFLPVAISSEGVIMRLSETPMTSTEAQEIAKRYARQNFLYWFSN